MNTSKPRLLSGMQPSADSLHLGNYIGALLSWKELQETHEAIRATVRRVARALVELDELDNRDPVVMGDGVGPFLEGWLEEVLVRVEECDE